VRSKLEKGNPVLMPSLESLSKPIPQTHEDLIVTDWKLPILGFEEFVYDLRRNPQCRFAPVAVLTGTPDAVRESVLSLGAFCCLQKPIGASTLSAVLKGISKSRNAVARGSARDPGNGTRIVGGGLQESAPCK
jgi:CheY-like chemotaxis protein